MIYLFDNSLKLIKWVHPDNLINPKIIDEPNLITFVTENKNNNLFDGIFYIGTFHPDEPDNFLIFKLMRQDVSDTKIVIGIHIFYDDLRGRAVEDIRPDEKPVSTVLSRYLNNTGWSVGRCTSNKTVSDNAYYISALEAVSKIIKETGVIIRPKIKLIDNKIASKTVEVHDQIGSDTGRRFRHGIDGVEVTFEEETTELYTALIGRGAGIKKTSEDTGEWTGGYTRRIMFTDEVWEAGKDPVSKPKGQKYIEIPERTALYGYPDGTPRIGIIVFDKEEDPKRLLQLTYEEVERISRPKLTFRVYRANAEGVMLGDRVVAIRDNLSFKTSIYKAIHNLKDKKLTYYEFGDKVTSATTARINKINKTISENEARNLSIMDDLQYQIASYYWGEDAYNYDLKNDNEYQIPAGYYSFDKAITDEPTKVTYMGGGKLMIANSKKADGSWDWRTVATGDGFYADQMFADYIQGNLIRGSVIESTAQKANGEPVSLWNLDTGKFSTADAEIYGDLFVDHPTRQTIKRKSVGVWLGELEDLQGMMNKTIIDLSILQNKHTDTIRQIENLQSQQASTISSVQQVANAANSAAAQAQSAANTAYSAASTANNAIAGVRALANTAQSTANTANSAASAAKTAIDKFTGRPYNSHGLQTFPITRLYAVYNPLKGMALEWEVNGVGYHVYTLPDGV